MSRRTFNVFTACGFGAIRDNGLYDDVLPKNVSPPSSFADNEFIEFSTSVSIPDPPRTVFSDVQTRILGRRNGQQQYGHQYSDTTRGFQCAVQPKQFLLVHAQLPISLHVFVVHAAHVQLGQHQQHQRHEVLRVTRFNYYVDC